MTTSGIGRKLIIALALTTTLIVGSANSASATNGSIFDDTGGGPATVTWNDLYDTLCANNHGGVHSIRARLVPVDGTGTIFRATDGSPGGKVCTGNLALGNLEDDLYYLQLQRCSASGCGSYVTDRQIKVNL